MNAFALLAIGLGLAVAGCAADRDGDESREASPSAARMIGRVASLHLAEGFVLIETSGPQTLEQGLLLSTVGDSGETSTLVISGERMGRYAAADFKSGDVAVGHAVFARPVNERADPGEAPDPDGENPPNPAPAGDGALEKPPENDGAKPPNH